MENYKLVTSQLVGIDHHVEHVKRLLNTGAKIVGIQGMSGIGKTNIAKAVCDSVSAQFDRCCFVEDVRDILSKSDGIVTLQSKILSDILRHDTKVRDSSQGIQKIKDRVCCWNSILIVLDNVDEGFVFADTFGDLAHFRSKSRFIITTVNEEVVNFFQKRELYKPKLMSAEIALELFSRHAFGMGYPPRDYINLSKEFVKVADSLPLALKAIGSVLFRQNKPFWVAMLKQLRDIPPKMVEERLKIIYKKLTTEEKHIFLDIACSFIGKHSGRPSYLWDALNLNPLIVIDSLCTKSWIKINDRNEFWMHDQYRNLARAIVRDEGIQNPWKRSRMWSNKDALAMLRDKKGTDKLDILRVDMEGEDFELTEKELKKLSGLKYLEVSNGKLIGDWKEILPDIRWLRLDNCRSIPVDFSPKKLVILDLWSCLIQDEWRGWNQIKAATELKIVDLRSCKSLSTIPELSQCRSLEQLSLQGCKKMRGELNIGNFENLKVLKLGFTKISKLTGDIRILKNLEEIDAGVSDLIEVPAGIGKLTSLKFLDLRSDKLQSKEVPLLPVSLKRLYLSSPRVPNLLELKLLEELWFSKCDTPGIPGDVWKLSKLKTLTLSDCSSKHLLARRRSRTPPSLPASLNSLKIQGCPPLERLPNLNNMHNLTELVLTHVGVRKLVGLTELRMLETFTLYDTPNLTILDGLQDLVRLKTLRLERCAVLERLPSLSNLSQLQDLAILSCGLVAGIQGLEELAESLSSLEISGRYMVGTMHSLSKFAKLTKLFLVFSGTNSHPLLPSKLVLDLPHLQCLKRLSITGCEQLTGLSGIERLESLQWLHLRDCTSIRELPDLSVLKNLKTLEVHRFTELTDVTGLENLESLATLTMIGCTSLKRLPILFEGATSLYITGCNQLMDLTGLEKLVLLQFLCIKDCPFISKLPDLSGHKELSTLDTRGCSRRLTEITGLEKLVKLNVLLMDSRLEYKYQRILKGIGIRRIH